MLERAKFVPHDQYDYGFEIIDGQDNITMIADEWTVNFNSLVGKQLLLANIGEKMLGIEQEKVRILVNMFDMARRSKKYFLNTFYRSYYSWKHQMQLTRAKNGKASEQAHSIFAGYPKPNQQYVGYEGLQDELDKREQSIFDKIFGQKKPPMQQPQG